jgi:hypothetical protein
MVGLKKRGGWLKREKNTGEARRREEAVKKSEDGSGGSTAESGGDEQALGAKGRNTATEGTIRSVGACVTMRAGGLMFFLKCVANFPSSYFHVSLSVYMIY